MANDLTTALADLQEQEALSIVEERLAKGDDPFKILEEANSEYFIPDLLYSGEILKGVSELVKPKITQEGEVKKIGKVVFGTVAGDIHDIAKDIVVFMLDINGFEVYDLGIDVPKEKFVEKIKETGAPVVGLSGFLTLAYDSMKETVEAIKEAGIRDKVKVMIGGGQITEDIMKYAGADAYGKDAMDAVKFSKQWIEGK